MSLGPPLGDRAPWLASMLASWLASWLVLRERCADESGVRPVRSLPRPVVATVAGKPGWENTSHRYELSDKGCAKTPSSCDVYSATGWHDMDRLLSC